MQGVYILDTKSATLRAYEQYQADYQRTRTNNLREFLEVDIIMAYNEIRGKTLNYLKVKVN